MVIRWVAHRELIQSLEKKLKLEVPIICEENERRGSLIHYKLPACVGNITTGVSGPTLPLAACKWHGNGRLAALPSNGTSRGTWRGLAASCISACAWNIAYMWGLEYNQYNLGGKASLPYQLAHHHRHSLSRSRILSFVLMGHLLHLQFWVHVGNISMSAPN